MQAKICGLTTIEQVETCISYGTNFCGFILNYKKSHRFIDYQTAKQLTQIFRAAPRSLNSLILAGNVILPSVAQKTRADLI